jgi:hypothetical protein
MVGMMNPLVVVNSRNRMKLQVPEIVKKGVLSVARQASTDFNSRS